MLFIISEYNNNTVAERDGLSVVVVVAVILLFLVADILVLDCVVIVISRK